MFDIIICSLLLSLLILIHYIYDPEYVTLLIDLTGTGDSAMSRRKSFKKSLRESFRRLRKRRSERRKRTDDKSADKPEQKRYLIYSCSDLVCVTWYLENASIMWLHCSHDFFVNIYFINKTFLYFLFMQ